MFKNRNLLIIALIAVVNAIGYGIIIPIIYPYSMRFGLSDFQNGLLFSVFSLCQFISTPIIGRLSDKYGRKPLLIISLTGTAISFFMAALAPSALFLFLARALDGITAGNIPVAAAVISDTTEMKDRAHGFGIIGASFGFGFVFGPAISALTVGFSPSLPFIIAGVISSLAVVLTAKMLPETNKHIGQIQQGKLFDFSKMFSALTDQSTGKTLLISFVYSFTFGMFIFAFQPFSNKVLHLSAQQISLIFTIFGVIGLIVQMFLIQKVNKALGLKKAFSTAFILVFLAYLFIFFSNNLPLFIASSILLALANSFINPLIQTILSLETDVKSQGTIMGLNQSYISIGSIFGPIIAGVLATLYIPTPFLVMALFGLVCFYLSSQVVLNQSKEHLF